MPNTPLRWHMYTVVFALLGIGSFIPYLLHTMQGKPIGAISGAGVLIMWTVVGIALDADRARKARDGSPGEEPDGTTEPQE